mmetsp:Transcript_2628/g.6148  ORF Transcript_2628/g.6148 Transcript_2628/m.6148 type:complete len:214 (+) Transcript_2628:544-1185(+)
MQAPGEALGRIEALALVFKELLELPLRVRVDSERGHDDAARALRCAALTAAPIMSQRRRAEAAPLPSQRTSELIRSPITSELRELCTEHPAPLDVSSPDILATHRRQLAACCDRVVSDVNAQPPPSRSTHHFHQEHRSSAADLVLPQVQLAQFLATLHRNNQAPHARVPNLVAFEVDRGQRFACVQMLCQRSDPAVSELISAKIQMAQSSRML